MNHTTDFTTRAKELVSRMTVTEMMGQLRHDAPAIPRLGIPAYNWWNEALHGAARSGTATVFPQAIGLAALFDDEFLREVADIAATEQRAKYHAFSALDDRGIYKGLTVWSPNINIFRDPRWGRGQETYGEDPFLSGRLGMAYIRGLQGDGYYLKTAACVKHLAAHSGPEPERHHFNAVVSPRDMEETYLPAFEACVTQADVNAVMGAYSAVNGEPCCASSYLMQQKLRGEWRFKGMYISDCWAIRDFHLGHKITATMEESASMALKAGCDLSCGCEYQSLESAFMLGMITQQDIETACIRVMTTRFQLGMFDDDCTYAGIGYEENEKPAHAQKAYEAACRSLVLLENKKDFLPLDLQKISSLAVIGPNADSRRALWGNYHGTSSCYTTILQGIKAKTPDHVRVFYSEGCALDKANVERLGEPNDRLAEAITIARLADVTILCLGLDESIEGEMHDDGNGGWAGDKKDLLLPESQRTLLHCILATGKPVVVVLLSGGALDPGIGKNGNARALIQAWYPGQAGGEAVADLLFGAFSPSGRLPITFYKAETQLPDFTDYSMNGRTYRFLTQEPLYPFGYGLSYTSFSYENMTVEEHESGDVTVSCAVTNTGKMAGRESVQAYCWIDHPDFSRHPALCGFRSVFLQPGETAHVHIQVADRAFTGVDQEGRRSALKGSWYISMGGHQPHALSEKLTGSASLTCEILRNKESFS